MPSSGVLNLNNSSPNKASVVRVEEGCVAGSPVSDTCVNCRPNCPKLGLKLGIFKLGESKLVLGSACLTAVSKAEAASPTGCITASSKALATSLVGCITA